VMICCDLMYEWLWCVRNKISGVEYAVAVISFLLIMFFGVTEGILGGIALSYCLTWGFGVVGGGVDDEDEGGESTMREGEATNLL